MPPDLESLIAENGRLKRRLERERATRLEAEAIAEKGLRDLYERQQELQFLERMATAANQSRTTRDILQYAVEEVVRFHRWETGHGFVSGTDQGQVLLRSADVWHAVYPEAVEAFRRVSQIAQFASQIGLPGRAQQAGKPMWIADLASDNNFPRLGVAQACGLRSAVAFPVLCGAEVVAVLEFFGTEPREPDPGMLDLMAQVGTQLGRVIERQRAEESLRAQTVALAKARDEAKDADRAKSSFLANMSHELRTPLNAIIGFSQMMQYEVAGPLNEKYRSYADDIQRSGIHLNDVVNGILDLSKIEVGALELRETPVFIPDITDACMRLVRPLADSAQVHLASEIAPDLPVLSADEIRLKQAVLNVLSNAVKFTTAGGRVTLGARVLGKELVITVADTGIGMRPEDVAVALQPFRQIDSALNRRYEGTGLGLPLARAFTELHGGRLEIDSAPGVGTTITLMIPLRQAA
ncbi:MAG TPA: GAF domain-containing sensor histidine kinase [Rhizomicrobium sp.]|nr:GAF domain-containing sensor histidine kinase [Rhizomicrobium sp.]